MMLSVYTLWCILRRSLFVCSKTSTFYILHADALFLFFFFLACAFGLACARVLLPIDIVLNIVKFNFIVISTNFMPFVVVLLWLMLLLFRCLLFIIFIRLFFCSFSMILFHKGIVFNEFHLIICSRFQSIKYQVRCYQNLELTV